jgi:hypothetical protein
MDRVFSLAASTVSVQLIPAHRQAWTTDIKHETLQYKRFSPGVARSHCIFRVFCQVETHLTSARRVQAAFP